MNSTIAPVIARVTRWDGVETDPTREAMTLHVHDRAFAHVSEEGVLTVPTTPAVRNQLLTDGFADGVPRRYDCVGYRVRTSADVPGAIRLLRVAYLQQRRQGASQLSSLETFETLESHDHLRRLGASSELLALLCAQETETDHESQMV